MHDVFQFTIIWKFRLCFARIIRDMAENFQTQTKMQVVPDQTRQGTMVSGGTLTFRNAAVLWSWAIID